MRELIYCSENDGVFKKDINKNDKSEILPLNFKFYNLPEERVIWDDFYFIFNSNFIGFKNEIYDLSF
jgi:hypothetical protein